MAVGVKTAHLAELNLAGRGRGPHGGRHRAAGPADDVRSRVIVLGRLQPESNPQRHHPHTWALNTALEVHLGKAMCACIPFCGCICRPISMLFHMDKRILLSNALQGLQQEWQSAFDEWGWLEVHAFSRRKGER